MVQEIESECLDLWMKKNKGENSPWPENIIFISKIIK